MPTKLNLDSATPPTTVDEEFKLYDNALAQLVAEMEAAKLNNDPNGAQLCQAMIEVQNALRVDDPGCAVPFSEQTHLIDRAIAVGQSAVDFINQRL